MIIEDNLVHHDLDIEYNLVLHNHDIEYNLVHHDLDQSDHHDHDIEYNLVRHDLHVNKACWKWRRRKVLRNKLLWPIAVPLPCTLYCIALSTIHCTRYCIALIIIQCTMYCIVLHCVLCIFLTSYCIVLDYFIQRIVLHNVWFCIFCVIVLYFLLRCFVFSFTLLCISYCTVLYFLFCCIAGNSPTWAATGATPPAVGGNFTKIQFVWCRNTLSLQIKKYTNPAPAG